MTLHPVDMSNHTGKPDIWWFVRDKYGKEVLRTRYRSIAEAIVTLGEIATNG